MLREDDEQVSSPPSHKTCRVCFCICYIAGWCVFGEGILVSASCVCVCGGVARSYRMSRSEVLLARTPLGCLATLSACACAAAVCCGAVCMCCWLDMHVAICTCLQCCSISVACCMCMSCCLETVSTSCLHVVFARRVCLSSPAHGVFFSASMCFAG